MTDVPDRPTAIDPRLRARRIMVRRDEGRRRLHRLIGLTVAAALIGAGYGVTRSPLLDVDRVAVRGAQHTPVDAVRQATGIGHGLPMTDVDLDRARAGVAALAWVKTASVARSWPGTIEVTVTERVAIAAVPAGTDGFALVDRDGRVLETSPTPPPGLAVLADVTPAGAPGSQLDPSAADALAVAAALPPALAANVTSVVASGPHGVELRLGTGGVVRLGTAEDLPAKLVAAQTVLGAVDLKDVCALDVRVPSAPSLTHGKSCA
jgi:cell division protein FtsQ